MIMTKFSKEYCEKENSEPKGDFSIEKIFQKLKPNTSKIEICKGFGKIEIIDRDEDCYIQFEDGTLKSYEELTGRNIEKKDNRAFWIGSIVIGAWLLSWLFLEIAYKGHPTIGEFGDMFGATNALFSGLAFVGVIYAIILQRKELRLQRSELRQTREEFKIQNDTLAKQRFENTFFQMIELHHEIVDKLSYRDTSEHYNPSSGTIVYDTTWEKRNMLSFAKKSLIDIIKIQIATNSNQDMANSDEDDIVIIRNLNAWKNIQDAYKEFYYKEDFGSKLSHYYMNLYHIFKFIYTNPYLLPKEKKDYSSIARAQLSQDELFLVYYNAMYEYHGNPKFLFLVKEFNLMENFDASDVDKFLSHQEIFNHLIENVNNQFDEVEVTPIEPLEIYQIPL